MNRQWILVGVAAAVTAGFVLQLGHAAQPSGPTEAERSLRATEEAFAATMADRDFEAFGSFVSDDAIFIGEQGPRRGKQAILEAWRASFDGEEAPFSWRPETVVVLPSADLGFTTGPVSGSDGSNFGQFNSVWRRDADGSWRIVFDRGCSACAEPR